MRDFRYMMVVAVAAAGLALAGCSSSSGVSTSERDAAVAAEQAKTKALQDRIDALYEALGIDEDADPNATIAELQTKAGELEQMVADKEKADAEAARMAAAKTGKDLFAALADDDAGSTPLTNIDPAATDLAASGLTINATAGAGTFTADPDDGGVELKAGDSVTALGSWNGTDYALSTGTGASKVTNEARVYNNRGAAKTVSFADSGITVNGDGNVEDITIKANYSLIRASTFEHQGTQTHQVPEKSDAVYIPGTYDGAPGEYSCDTDCSSTNNGSGAPSVLGGTWTFTPDEGAMVSRPDAHYLYYGWWVSKDSDGMPTAASAFAGRAGTESNVSTDGLDPADNRTGLTGSATYVGHAAGKFALDYSRNKVLDGASHGGHFTADAELKATFGSGATAGVTGTIDNFRLNDGTEDPGWGVALNDGRLGAAGAIEAPTDGNALATVWSINGTKAAASGTWSGQMYDETPGDPPNGDGNNIPTTVTGTFYSEYGASTSSVVGRMVGAFGANKQ